MAILWRDKQDIQILMNIHNAPAYRNFCNVGRKAIKLQIVMNCKHHMGYVDKRSMMANSYSINHLTLKWKKKLLFHLLDLTILHRQLHSSFLMWELQNFTQKFLIHPCEKYVGHTGQEQSAPRPLWRPTSIAAQVSRLSGGTAKNGLLHIPCNKDSQECEAKSFSKVP